MNELKLSGAAGKIRELASMDNGEDIDMRQKHDLLKDAMKTLGIRQEFMAKAIGMNYHNFNRRVREYAFSREEIHAASLVMSKLFEIENGSVFRKSTGSPKKDRVLEIIEITGDISKRLDDSSPAVMIKANLRMIYSEVKKL